MTGRHALDTRSQAHNLANPAVRGLTAALVVGGAAALIVPNAAADTAAAPAKAALSNPHAQDVAAGIAGTTSATSEWKIEQINIQSAAPAVEVAAPAASATTAAADAATSSSDAEAAPAAAGIGVEVEAAPSVIGSSVLDTALSGVGSPYVWAGTTPSGWDCIGFVRWVYAQHGVAIGGRTTSVLSVGRQVSYAEARPGDILYWPGHVAISLGNGQNVAAWNPGMGTRVGPDSWCGDTPIVIRVS